MENLVNQKVKVDAVITDLPYGVTDCEWDIPISFKLMWEKINKLIKDSGAIVLFGVEPFSSKLRLSNIKNFKYDWIWQKNKTSNFACAKKQPLRNHEIISIFYKKQCTYNFIKEPRFLSESSKKRMDYAFNTVKGKNVLQKGLKKVKVVIEDKELSYPKTVQFFKAVANTDRNRIHPTQKPVALLEYLMKTYTNENDLVIDFTMGSGSTGIACINCKRRFIGIEKNKEIFLKAKNRLEKHLLRD